MYHGACHIEPFSDGHDGTSLKWSSVAIISSVEITSKHCLFVKSILSGLPWDAPCQRHPLIPSSAQTSTPNFDLFFSPLYGCNFQTNDNQTFNVYPKSTLSMYRKGLCGFFGFGIHPRRKVTWSKVLQVLWTRACIKYVN